MNVRIPCVVPTYRRTRQSHTIWDEWLCPKHWGMVPKRMRQTYSRAKRRKKPFPALVRLWCRCKAVAIHADFTEGWR